MSNKNYNPNIAIHPGETLRDLLQTIEMSQIDLAKRVDLTPKTINRIIKGNDPITSETAIRLSAVFGMSASFWNNLQMNYERTLTRLRFQKQLNAELPYLRKFQCYSELSKLGYVKNTKDAKERVISLLHLFGVKSLSLIPSIDVYSVAFRKSKHKKNDICQESLAAWLRCGEIEAKKVPLKKFDRHKLKNTLVAIRRLTKEQVSVSQNKLIEICASCGVAVVFVPYFKQTYVNAATRWLSPDKAVIQASLKGMRVDGFWFSFFHELKHLLDCKKKEQFIDFKDIEGGDVCKKADEFARDILIPKLEFAKFKSENVFSDIAIKKFANKLGIDYSIVAGRLSYEEQDYKKWDHLRKKLEWVS